MFKYSLLLFSLFLGCTGAQEDIEVQSSRFQGSSAQVLQRAEDIIELVATQDTFIKQSEAQSSSLRASEKCTIPKGSIILVKGLLGNRRGHQSIDEIVSIELKSSKSTEYENTSPEDSFYPTYESSRNEPSILASERSNKEESCRLSSYYIWRPHFYSEYQESIGKTFPYTTAATANYEVAPRSFGSGRDRGARLHAGVDLYAPVGRPIYAVGDGKVIDFYPFYDGTYALVVDHGDFIVRYGEVKRNLPSGVRVGRSVRQGQHIASVGLLISLGMHMLHFEMYSGTVTGPLTTSGNRYRRRGDLVDPTSQLKAWPYSQ